MKVAIVDNLFGNLRSICSAMTALGADVQVVRDAESSSGHLVLPGVGAFGASVNNLRASGQDEVIRAHVERGDPFLGICLGFQVLFERGSELGQHTGLGIFEGSVDRFQTDLHIPHVGWNVLNPTREHPLFDGVGAAPHVYFVHSYHANGVAADDAIATSDYGEEFVCAVARDSAAGFQFHPEKSGATGLRMLKNFLEWRP